MFDTNHLHPMLVHFPIALIMVGFLADIIFLFYKKEKCLYKTGFYLMILSTLGVISAFGSGYFFAIEPTEGEIVKIYELHETCALITMIIAIIGLALRIYIMMKKKEDTQLKWVVLSLYLLGAVFVSVTGFLGGNMVYTYMIGI